MPLIPDIRISVQNQAQLILDPVVKGGQFQRSRNGQLLLYAGGFTAVFPVIINGEKWAFRCWHVPITDASNRLRLVSEFILNNRPSYLVPLEYTAHGIIVKGEIYPTTRMKWIEGKTIKKYLCENVGKKQSLLSLASTFLSLIEDMHRLGISHGDLQHGNILVTENEDMFLVDYDSMYVPTMGNEYKDEIVGKEDYQHPKRKHYKISSSKVDYFSELSISLSIIGLAENPQLSTKYKLPDTEFLLFSATDFKDIERSAVYKDLQSLDIPLVNHLLDMLSAYLKVDDINKLTPFNEDGKFKTLLSSYFKSEDDLWLEVKSVDSIDAYQNFLKQYPRGRYNLVARRKLNDLLEKQLNEEDDNLWKNAERTGTLSSYIHYVTCSRKKLHLSEAKRKIDKFRWNVALNRGTLDAFQTYLNETDLGLYRDQAQRKVEDLLWERACRLNTEHSYRNYIKSSLQKTHRTDAYIAIELIYWKYALSNDSVEYYNEYLSKSKSLFSEFDTPTMNRTSNEFKLYNSKVTENRNQAYVRLDKLEEELWTKLAREDLLIGYEFYLKQFPLGKYIGECNQRVSKLRDEEKEENLWKKARMSHSLTGYRNYLKDTILNKHKEEALEKIFQYDEEAWQKAESIDTEESYRSYVEQFPSGIHIHDANRKIESINSTERIKKGCGWILAMMIIIGIIVLCIVASSAPGSGPSGTSIPGIEQGTSGIPNTVNVSEIEKDVLKIINGAEKAKANGDPINYSRLREAENLLNQMKKSPKYNEYKRKIDAIK